MRYCIAHLVQGAAKKHHHTLVEDIASRFDLKLRPEYFPSHITLKAPFEKDDLSIVELELEKFAEAHHVHPFVIHKFGHFERSAIFLETSFPRETARVAHGLQNALRKQTPQTSWRDYEAHKNFHLTVTKDASEKFEDIWEYLKEMGSPQFELLFDNIALLHFQDGAWSVDKVYQLKPSK